MSHEWVVSIVSGVVVLVGVFVLRAIFQAALHAALDAIMHELTPNDGKSMRDAVNRIETRLVRIEDRLGKVEEEVEPPRKVPRRRST
jgi:hypothetical protein